MSGEGPAGTGSPLATETFRSVGSVVSGAFGLTVLGVIVVVGLLESGSDFPVWGLALCALLGVLVYASMLRPRLRARDDELELRGMLETVTVPLAGISELVVRQVLALRVGEKRYISPAVGRSMRRTVRDDRNAGRPEADASYAARAESRLLRRADDARAKAGIRRFSAEQDDLAAQVRREPAWIVIAPLVVSAGVMVVDLLV